MFTKYALACCNSIAVLALFLVVAIFIPTFSMDFYRAEYTKYGISQRIGVPEDQLMTVTKRLTDYMRGRAEDLVITADVNGVSREFFDDRDKAHMVDVKDLFTIARAAFAAAICVLAVTWFLLRKDARLLARTALWLMLGLLVLLIALVGVIALDFNHAFNIFHSIFFNNDLWQLDPATSLLVNIVPQEFFVDIAARVGLIFGGLTLGYMCLAFVYLRVFSRRGI